MAITEPPSPGEERQVGERYSVSDITHQYFPWPLKAVLSGPTWILSTPSNYRLSGSSEEPRVSTKLPLF